MNGWLTLRSEKPCSQLPEHCFVARFGLLSADNRKFYISWEKAHRTMEIVNGYLVVKFIFGQFSDNLDVMNVDNGVFDHEVTSDFIKKSILGEMYYECALSKKDAMIFNMIDLDIVTFEVSEEGKVHQFPLTAFHNQGLLEKARDKRLKLNLKGAVNDAGVGRYEIS